MVHGFFRAQNALRHCIVELKSVEDDSQLKILKTAALFLGIIARHVC